MVSIKIILQAITYAENGSEELALAYGNRSAALYYTKQYKVFYLTLLSYYQNYNTYFTRFENIYDLTCYIMCLYIISFEDRSDFY